METVSCCLFAFSVKSPLCLRHSLAFCVADLFLLNVVSSVLIQNLCTVIVENLNVLLGILPL